MVESARRALVQRLQASPDVDDAELAALRITVPNRTPSAVPVPTPRPVARIDASRLPMPGLHRPFNRR